MRGRAAAAVFFALSCLTVPAVSAADRPLLLTLSGGIHPVFASGDSDDYLAGTNDFPVTPFHAPAWAGLGLGWRAGRWLFELEGRWIAPAAVVLEDPSDGDTLALDASPRWILTLGAFFRLSKGRFQPYLGAAGGVDAARGGEVRAVSRYGYTVVLPAPSLKERFSPLLAAGGGILVRISGRLGARLDARYVWVFEASGPVRGVQAGGGLTLSF